MRQQGLFDNTPENVEAPWIADSASDQTVATIIFSEMPWGPFDYRVPSDLMESIAPGKRVAVPLGRGNRTVTGFCVALTHESGGQVSRPHKLKFVDEVVDDRVLASDHMLQLTKWMSDYYLARWGQVLQAGIPSGVRTSAGTREVTFYELHSDFDHEEIEKLPGKQRKVAQMLAGSPMPLTGDQLSKMAGCTMAPIRSLVKKGVLNTTKRRINTGNTTKTSVTKQPNIPLNADQSVAYDAIIESLRAQQYETLLMHGVTGSGKTEVYMQAIEEVIRYRRQAIVLVPEISLTPQTCERFQSRFDTVAVLHSHLSDAERHWHWQQIADGNVQVVIGARSAIFAPTPHLGLVILDEEHEPTFKQETIPRYHARDVAIKRAQLEGIPLVLGSATPSLESWQSASAGEFKLLSMPSRVLDRPLPHVSTIDLRAEYKSKSHRGVISRPLVNAIKETLNDNGQIILLLNRRGYSTSIQCPSCGHVVNCPQCEIPLTHHKFAPNQKLSERAICHWCEYEINAPDRCPDCSFDGIRYGGVGTQKLETEINARFPEATCLRMDSDTMTRPNSHEKALDRFRKGDVQILVGTQMIAKGLDFPNVTLVGVINADTALHLPDFRAGERTFQLVTQVAGRTGRGSRGGYVLVQTFTPEHPAIQAAVKHQFEMFAEKELPGRQQFGYPPFCSMVRLIVRGPDEQQTMAFADLLARNCRNDLEGSDARILGPAPAPLARIRDKFRCHVLLMSENLNILQQSVKKQMDSLKSPSEVQWVVDVDPLSLL